MALHSVEAESVLGLCSGCAQYSAQGPQRTARERNTTPLSHLADIPVLHYSLPYFFPPSSLVLSGSISHTRSIRMCQWGVFLYVCSADKRLFTVCVCVCVQTKEDERVKEMKRMFEMEANEDKYTGKHGMREGITDGEKLGSVSEYNTFSYEP